MRVFKFGGASIENAERIKNLGHIVQNYLDKPLVLVISALGKTTNSLEEVVKLYLQKKLEEAAQAFEFIAITHNALAQDLLGQQASPCIEQLKQIYAEADWILNAHPVREADYYYDQIVCLGELMSTTIIGQYLNTIAPTRWVDIRDILRTDQTWREGNVDLDFTQLQVTNQLLPLIETSAIVLTQGFIGATSENESTTLGREGSDYTGALLANMLNADSLSIWKDVKGLLSGDPKIFNQVLPIHEISYTEVIEMAYYGAQVIHPKTIKPLQNKHIPLYVKCFLDPSLKGTAIVKDKDNLSYPPILVLKRNQVLLKVTSKDFSFITDDKLSEIYEGFHQLQAHINMIQNTAISFLACVDNHEEKLQKIIDHLSDHYHIKTTKNIQLLTIRHYHPEIIQELTQGHTIHLTQKTTKTVQYLLEEGSIHL
jgi:aspartate kinase